MRSSHDEQLLVFVTQTLGQPGFNDVCVDTDGYPSPTPIKGFVPHATAYYNSRFYIVETVTSAVLHYEDTPQRHLALVEAARQRHGVFVTAVIGPERIFADAVLALIDPTQKASRVWHYQSASLTLPKV